MLYISGARPDCSGFSATSATSCCRCRRQRRAASAISSHLCAYQAGLIALLPSTARILSTSSGTRGTQRVDVLPLPGARHHADLCCGVLACIRLSAACS